MSATNDPLQVAFGLHQSGQLAEAERLYRQFLESQPRHADALHLLGLVEHQSGRHQAAAETIARALAIQPGQPVMHFHLGAALQALNRAADAAASYQTALRLNPRLAPAHYNLGLLHHNNGDLAGAEQHYTNAIRIEPNYADAHNNLGRVLQSQKKLAEAEAAYRAAVQYQPSFTAAKNNLASVLVGQQRFAEAVELLRQAVREQPAMPECHLNLGRAYRGLNQFNEAVASFQEALRLRPDYLAPRTDLAMLLQELGHLDAAETQFREALRYQPTLVEALINLANLLHSQRKFDEPLALYNRATELQPNLAVAHFNRAVFLDDHEMVPEALAGYQEAARLQPSFSSAYINMALIHDRTMRPDEAFACASQAIALDPEPAARTALAGALRAQGRTEEAIAWYQSALEMQSNAAQHSNFLYCLNFDPRYEPAQIHAEHLAWAKRYAEPLTAAAPPHTNDRTPDRRLRIGYVSPHFRDHAVNYFTEPLITAHDHERFEVFCYSATHPADEVTARLRQTADHWREVGKRTDEQLAGQVRGDRIDILVDLTGHIGENRLLAFARKPAPIQVTYIGYQNTTGMSAMDYRLTDALADPLGETDRYYTERLVRLPRAFFCYQPSSDSPELSPLPALEQGHVTFGSFNHIAKVMPRVMEAWLEILSRVAGSRLYVLANRGGYVQQHWHDAAVARGLDPGRVVVCDKRPRVDYLRLIQAADIALDPFPFNGHTTTCDSIWMGVPVVMLQGHTYVSRFGGSVLANVDLEDLITHSPEEYVERAVSLAGDLDRLAQLRRELRSRMAASPLLDFQGFTRHVEDAYRQMWHTWCAR